MIPLLASSLALAAALSAPAGPTAIQAHATIPLGDFMGRLRSVEVTANGQTGTFLLDTGGGVSFVTPEFAKRIDCRPWGTITGFRLTGERLDLSRCDGVAIGLPGGKALAPLAVGVLELKSLLPPDAPAADGSLALDALDGQVFTLDLRAGTLEFETAGSLASRIVDATEIPIRVARHAQGGHGVGLYARKRVAKGDLWLEIDSGGGAPVLLRDAIAADAGADAAVAQAQPYTLLLPGLEGEVSLQTRVIVRDMIHDGVVGMPVLVHWRITLDLAGDRMWIAPAQ